MKIAPDDLSAEIIQHFEGRGHFVSRLTQQWLPRLLAIVDGQPVFVEVVTDEDKLSEDQKATIASLEASWALVFVASDFKRFSQCYDQWFARRLDVSHVSF